MTNEVASCSPEAVVYSVRVDVGEYEEISFEFTYRMDGSGTCKDLEYDNEEIDFAWEPSILDGLDPEKRDEVLQDHATEIFWDEINEQLDEERVLRESDYGSESLSFENGSEEELERVVRLALYSVPFTESDEQTSCYNSLEKRTTQSAQLTHPIFGSGHPNVMTATNGYAGYLFLPKMGFMDRIVVGLELLQASDEHLPLFAR